MDVWLIGETDMIFNKALKLIIMNVTNALKEGTIKILARLNFSSLANFFSSLGLPHFRGRGRELRK